MFLVATVQGPPLSLDHRLRSGEKGVYSAYIPDLALTEAPTSTRIYIQRSVLQDRNCHWKRSTDCHHCDGGLLPHKANMHEVVWCATNG